MKYTDFERIMSQPRMRRYLSACGGDGEKAITLYMLNLQLSQELFTLVGCFEVALRNAIDKKCLDVLGNDWLKNAAAASGRFDNEGCAESKKIIDDAVSKLGNKYSHHNLVPELGLGFWRHLFADDQYKALDKILLSIFPSKPRSQPPSPNKPAIQYNQGYIRSALADINQIRNRIAHHESICFRRKDKNNQRDIKDTTYAQKNYNLVIQLFQWMNIDPAALLYGIDHINEICAKINSI